MLGLWLLVAAGPATRPEGSKLFSQSEFSRYTEAEDRPRLQTSVFTLKGDDGFTVDLIAAVHIADASYYPALNSRFQTSYAVLSSMLSAWPHALPPRR